MAFLKANEVFTKISNKYTYFIEIFLPKLAVKLFKYIGTNNYIIELMND